MSPADWRAEADRLLDRAADAAHPAQAARLQAEAARAQESADAAAAGAALDVLEVTVPRVPLRDLAAIGERLARTSSRARARLLAARGPR